MLVRQPNGNIVRVSNAVVEHELTPAPPDGFTAFLYQRRPNAESLAANLAEVIERLLRESKRTAISASEIKRDLLPIISEQHQKWDSWWKKARPNLLRSDRIKPNPKKKNSFVLAQQPESTDVAGAVERAGSPAELLQACRELSGADAASQIAMKAAHLSLQWMARPELKSSDLVSLVLALAYISDRITESDLKEAVKSAIGRLKSEHAALRSREIEDDLLVVLPKIARLAPSESADLLSSLLDHSSPMVAEKAFSSLNTDRNRDILKRRLLTWLENDNEVIRLSSFLRTDFICHVRREDQIRLYLRLAGSDGLQQQQPVKDFLGRQDIAMSVLSSPEIRMEQKLSMLSMSFLSVEQRANGLEALADEVMRTDVTFLKPGLDSPLASFLCINTSIQKLEWALRAAEVIRLPLLFASCARVARELAQNASGEILSFLLRLLAKLRVAGETRYPGSLEEVDKSLTVFANRLITDSDAFQLNALSVAIRSQLDLIRQEAVVPFEQLQRENEALRIELLQTQQHRERAEQAASVVSSAASSDKSELERRIRLETARPFLLVADELERQLASRQSDLALTLLQNIRTALASLGIEAFASSGENVPFDAALHEFSAEPKAIPAIVSVLRSGYAMSAAQGQVIIRRAIVTVGNLTHATPRN